MDLKAYFAKQTGTGVLATADAEGRTDAAIYARPSVLDDGTVAVLMRERRSWSNVQVNPFATYLFIEAGGGYRGMRMTLKKIRDDQDPVLMEQMTRGWITPEEDREKGPKHVVYFSVEETRPLVG